MTETLNMIIIKLAEYFDMSVKFLQAHLMEYVLEYGKYKLISNIATDTIIAFVLSVVFIVVFAIISCLIIDLVCSNLQSFLNKNKKKILIIFIGLVSFFSLLPAIYNITAYKISPTIYSLKQIQQDFINKESDYGRN